MSHFAGPVHAPSQKNSDSRRPAARPQARRLPPSQQAARWQALQLKAAETAPAAPAQAAAVQNRGGLPARLKAGVERLSGLFMDDVRVHRNSSEPAKLGALAYTKGSDIHLAPGQERHLPHEAWHVVQQKEGRVKPTIQLKAGVSLNDDRGLEREADQMGAKALSEAAGSSATLTEGPRHGAAPSQQTIQRMSVRTTKTACVVSGDTRKKHVVADKGDRETKAKADITHMTFVSSEDDLKTPVDADNHNFTELADAESAREDIEADVTIYQYTKVAHGKGQDSNLTADGVRQTCVIGAKKNKADAISITHFQKK